MDQRGELDEQPAHPVALDQGAQDAGGEVRLAGARGADEEQAGLAEGAVLLDELLDVALGRGARVHQLRPLARRAARGLEGGDLAVLIARRDARPGHQAGHHVTLAAGAGAGGSRPTIRDDDPPPAAAFRAGLDERFRHRHGEIVAWAQTQKGREQVPPMRSHKRKICQRILLRGPLWSLTRAC